MYEKQIREVESLIQQQNEWRMRSINLIASENVMSARARAQAGSDFAHRYAEGHPGERYYRGTKYIDSIENMLKDTLRALFECTHSEVRPISGTNANEAVFSRLIGYNDVVIVNSTPGGGHISHHKAGSVGKFTRNIIDFPLTPDGYHLDAGKTKDLIMRVKPRLIVLGKSLFLFPEPIAQLVDVCNEYKVTIIYDGAHVLGLIAGKQFQDPLKEGAELITASTHKTFFGSQRGVVLSNVDATFWRKIDRGAFPGSSSNHHLHTLAQMAICAYEMMEFGQQYAQAVTTNAKALAKALDECGFDVEAKEFGYTESHQVAVNVRKYGGGDTVSINLEMSDIILNMNMLPHEGLSTLTHPDGIRIGVQEMTRFGMGPEEMRRIAELMKECIIDKKNVKDEVNKFRAGYQEVKYSFDARQNSAEPESE
ncbi:MAG TPA: serine hydroxymethyltransferase [Thermodesulfobacteriota bacterium]|nr:serine hydroxymethyltransferase [Thermodesulfobacteriota bacterium]HNU71295.1 serine hydroxymethyltransferase [Thermodesulfobacteriota bacterium]HOC38425.1 serine hydroxymethyltransferase [Thermodesulfobacteriota bacterium]